MKKIEAIFKCEKLNDVKDALEVIGHIGMTVSEVQGRGVQRGIALKGRVGEYRVDFLPKMKLEMVIRDEDCDEVVDIICEAARNGGIGDGKIFIYDIAEAVRIRTGERGTEAL